MESCMHISKQVWLMNVPDSQCGMTGGYFSLALYSSSLLMRVSMMKAKRWQPLNDFCACGSAQTVRG